MVKLIFNKRWTNSIILKSQLFPRRGGGVWVIFNIRTFFYLFLLKLFVATEIVREISIFTF